MLRRKKTQKPLNEELLNEELNRHFRILEYTFYTPEEESIIPEADDENQESDNQGGEDNQDNQVDLPDETKQEPTPIEPTPEPAPVDVPTEDEVEVDISDIIKGGQEAKESIDKISGKIDIMMKKYAEINHRLASINSLEQKIEGLEHEIEKRNPTEEEKLQLRSIDSAPFNLKLSDFWADKEGIYDVMDKGDVDKQYVVTQKDVDDDYNEQKVKNSLTDFEDEEI